MKKTIAAAVLTLGLGAYALPPSAAEYYGGDVWTKSEPSRMAPADVGDGGNVMSYVDDDRATLRDGDVSRSQVFERKDEAHSQW